MYRDWRGPVYPSDLPQRRWLEHYSTLFDTVEVNNSFYRLPAQETVEGWARQVPAGFSFALKLGAFGSHRMKLRDAASWLPNHVDRAGRLGAALGPTLVQLPPRWRRDSVRLDEFLSVAPRAMRWAVELREPSWLHESVLDVLRAHDAALCVHDLLADHPWERTAATWSYVRFHGAEARERRYTGRYGGRRLWRVADRLGGWMDEGCEVFVYFNNDQRGDAVADARWMAARLGTLVEPR
jgi:uncharacterized protein YecE (DUF72 family)